MSLMEVTIIINYSKKSLSCKLKHNAINWNQNGSMACKFCSNKYKNFFKMTWKKIYRVTDPQQPCENEIGESLVNFFIFLRDKRKNTPLPKVYKKREQIKINRKQRIKLKKIKFSSYLWLTFIVGINYY